MQQFNNKKEIADVGIHETPTPLESANVGNGDTPPPLQNADILKWMVPKITNKEPKSEVCQKMAKFEQLNTVVIR